MNVSLDDVQVRGFERLKRRFTNGRKVRVYYEINGKAEKQGSAIHLSVEPTLLPSHHPLSNVNNEFNAVYVHGQAVGSNVLRTWSWEVTDWFCCSK